MHINYKYIDASLGQTTTKTKIDAGSMHRGGEGTRRRKKEDISSAAGRNQQEGRKSVVWNLSRKSFLFASYISHCFNGCRRTENKSRSLAKTAKRQADRQILLLFIVLLLKSCSQQINVFIL
jgi:hypothetical protein